MARLTHLLLAVWFLVVATGMPLPARVGPPRSGAERFPCENCPCGCATAEHCWRDCCCLTPPQRLAWARRVGVRPPGFALAAAQKAGLDVSPWVESKPATALCTAPDSAAPDSAAPDSAAPVCTTAPSRPGCCCCQAEQAPSPAPGIALLRAMECDGLSVVWLVQGSTPPPEAVRIEGPVHWEALVCLPAAWRVCCAAPPTPPPPQGAEAVIWLG
ncbi:hypothetical protein Pla175_49980 [Pirellulimonas nuda]|uniref:Uncharacterized protein n=1 Tax=Pirellulimonas nuda TaxID=2528009 RepID=A0A518DJA7_9BACT|nr:hypothetical protein [Pirellulimonas nuda]QDU91569.1 hypothetical protein Pla175_49980 [Pirellulimonas nuda]